MLPILRTTLLGGALAAAAFLTGFTVPDATRPHLARTPSPAVGPLQDAQNHPEWKQLLVAAALQRAAEVERLRELPGQIVTLASLPPKPTEVAPDDANASVTDAPENVLPIDIGETSSTELPVSTPLSVMPPAEKPQSLQPDRRSEAKPARKRIARRKLAPPAKPANDNPFAALFGPTAP